MRLHLLRHLAPAIDAGICYGRSDLACDSAAVEAALPPLRALLPLHAPLYASPLRRCAVLAGALGVPVTYDARLAELDFGTWELRPWDSIGRADVDAWAADLLHYRPGGGESVMDMALRVGAFYEDLRARRLPLASIVCHAGSMRILAALARGLAPADAARAAAETPHRIAYGEIVILDCV